MAPWPTSSIRSYLPSLFSKRHHDFGNRRRGPATPGVRQKLQDSEAKAEKQPRIRMIEAVRVSYKHRSYDCQYVKFSLRDGRAGIRLMLKKLTADLIVEEIRHHR